jgi:hypothetical protein
VVDHLREPGRVVDAHPVGERAVDAAVHLDDRQLADERLHRGSAGREVVRADDHAVDLALDERPQAARLHVDVALGVAEEQLQALARQPPLDGLDEGGEERVGDLRHEHADRAGLLRAQRAGDGVVPVAQLLGGRQYLAGRLRLHGPGARQHPGNRGCRHPSELGDVVDRGHGPPVGNRLPAC